MAPTPEFCGIDPDGMGELATSLCGAADRLTAFSREFEGRLRQNGIETPALREIREIARWGGLQVSMLRRRIELINALGAGAPELGGTAGTTSMAAGGQGLVRLPDELKDFDRAQELAKLYNGALLVSHHDNPQTRRAHSYAEDIAELAGNPQAAAAFFVLLSPKVRDGLPNLIANTGSKTAKQDLAAFGKALGAALRAPTLVPAFTKVRDDLVRPADNKAAAWNRLALLKAANAPSSLRSAAARTLALDDFAKNPRQDWRAGGPAETKKYGLPTDLVAMGLEVLDGDGAAVRDAFSRMGGTGVTLSQADKMQLFLDHAKRAGTGDEVADAFGRAMEAGTEATTEKAGQHSPEAAAFALDAIRVAGSFGSDLPKSGWESMNVIAKSYIHELASGARFDKAVYRDSGMGVPENWVPLPSVTPAFYLSPGDTYRFLKTFVGDKRLTDDFDATAAQFRYDALTAAARLDAQGTTRYFEDTAKAFGDLAGVEFKATLDVRGEQDALNDMIVDIAKNTVSFAVGGISPTSRAAVAGWELAKTYGVSYVLDEAVDLIETGVEQATGARADFVLRLKYDMARLLHDAGYPASDPPAEIINKSTGNLKTYDELVAEAKREAGGDKKLDQALKEKLTPYERWMDSNERFDKKAEEASTNQGSERPKQEVDIWD